MKEDSIEIEAIKIIDRFYKLFSTELENTISLREATYCAIASIENTLSVLGGVWADIAAGEARSCQYTQEHIKFYEKILEYLKSKQK